MGQVIKMPMAQPKEIVEKMGRHKFVLNFCPDADDDHRWRWSLRVTTHIEHYGSAINPAMCRVNAQYYADLYP